MRFQLIDIYSILRVTLFEDPAYHSLMEKILANKSLLLKEFEKVDNRKTGNWYLK